MQNLKETDGKKVLKYVAIFIFSLSIILYAFFGARDLIFGVRIKGVNIVDGATFTESVQKVEGNAKNAIKLYLNGREISIDQKGYFSETIALLSGYNRLIIEAEDKFGNKDEQIYQLILIEEPQNPQILEGTASEDFQKETQEEDGSKSTTETKSEENIDEQILESVQ